MITIIAIAVLIFVDQITKHLATTYLQPVGSMPFIPGIMELRYIVNDGAAFSLFAGNRWFLIGFTSIALVAVAIYFIVKKPQSKTERIALTLILAGGIGNLIDRALYGFVVDFFAATFINFAIFNVADCFVVIGAFLLIFATIFEEMKTAKKQKHSEIEKENASEKDSESAQLLNEEQSEKSELNLEEIAK